MGVGAWGDSGILGLEILASIFLGGRGWLDLRRDFFGRN